MAVRPCSAGVSPAPPCIHPSLHPFLARTLAELVQEYSRLAGKDGVSLDVAGKGPVEFSVIGQAGAYRRVMAQAQGLRWRLRRHANPHAELADAAPEADEGQFLALQLEFSLPSSAYATMLVRELTKQTAAALQTRWEPAQGLAAAPAADGAPATP